jgi:hypothetical protein
LRAIELRLKHQRPLGWWLGGNSCLGRAISNESSFLLSNCKSEIVHEQQESKNVDLVYICLRFKEQQKYGRNTTRVLEY